MKKIINTFCLGCITLLLFLGKCGAVRAESILAVTASLPPFTISPEERGISHDLLMEMSKRSGVDIEIDYIPWGKAQKVAQENPDTLIFSIGRTAAREKKYNWIVQLGGSNTVFVTYGKKIDYFQQAKELDYVTVLAKTPRDKKLRGEKFTNLARRYNVEGCADLLGRGLVDAWYTLDVRAKYILKKEGMNTSELVFGDPTNVLYVWLASNLEFDEKIEDKLVAAMESIKADGTYDAIAAKYLD